MTRHLTPQELEDYRRRVMPAMDLLIVNDHLASCEECYSKFYPKTLLASTYNSARADLDAAENEDLEHLSFDQILAYADDELDGIRREIAGAHLEICSECQEVCRDLQRFKSDLALGKVYTPRPRTTLWRRLARLWQSPSYRIPIRVMAFGAAAAVMLWFVTSALRQEVRDLRAQVEKFRQQPGATKDEAAANLQAQLEQLREENRRLQEQAQAMTAELKAPRDNTMTSPLQPLIAINDAGGRVTLDNRGGLEGVRFISPDHRQAVLGALRSGRVEKSPELSYLTGERKQLMDLGRKDSEQKEFVPLSPVGVVVATAQPTLRWKPLAGATSYTVTIYRDNLREVASSPPLTGTEWTPPLLERGQIYLWQIRAVKDGREIISPTPDTPDARFSILGQAQLSELERARQLYSKSHLTLGVLYARMGLMEESASEFRALLSTNPRSLVVAQLVRSVTDK